MIKMVASDKISSALDKLSRKMKDMSPVMSSIGMELEKRASNRFETETDPNGKRWAAHKPSTVKRSKGGNGQILNHTGEMLRSLNHQSDSNSVMVGFGEPYAFFHERGTKRMVRRGLLFSDPVAGTLGTGDEQAVLSIAQDYLRKVIP